MHPAVKKKLRQYFAIPNQKLYAIVGKAYPWDSEISSSEDEEHAVASTGEHLIIPMSDQLTEKEKKSYATAVELLPQAVGRKESRSRANRTISVSAVV